VVRPGTTWLLVVVWCGGGCYGNSNPAHESRLGGEEAGALNEVVFNPRQVAVPRLPVS
jgi:hypothetical protein